MHTLNKLWMSTKYSLAGLRATWKRELAFRIEAIVALILFPLLFILSGLTMTQKVIMLITLITPMVLELLNSAIETLCNLLTTKPHEEIKFIKDAASGAVFLANLLMILTWGLCLWPLF